MRNRGRIWVGLALLCGFGCSQGEAAGSTELRVFASASFTEAFQALAVDYEAQNPELRLSLHFAGTPRLALQLREGVQADVFASADRQSLDELSIQLGMLVAGHSMASNQMVIAIARGNPLAIQSLADLARPDLRLAWAGPQVPAGRFALQVLAQAGVDARSLSDESSVRAALHKLTLGEIDATLAYSSDIAQFGDELESVAIPAQQQVEIDSVICVWPSSKRVAAAQEFVDFVLSPAGLQILSTHGFGAPAK